MELIAEMSMSQRETAARWRSYSSELGERSFPMNILWMSRVSIHSTRHSFTGDQAKVTQLSPGYVMTIAFGICATSARPPRPSMKAEIPGWQFVPTRTHAPQPASGQLAAPAMSAFLPLLGDRRTL